MLNCETERVLRVYVTKDSGLQTNHFRIQSDIHEKSLQDLEQGSLLINSLLVVEKERGEALLSVDVHTLGKWV